MKLLVVIAMLLSGFVTASPVFDMVYLTDTIPPPPPGSPDGISGSSEVCVGDTSVYSSDIPLGCEANWYINGVLQNSLEGTLEVIWNESGIFTLSLEFECDTTTYTSDSMLVIVNDVPFEPAPIQGDTAVCILATTFYATEVGDGESCEWIVDGIIQISDSAMMSYFWAELGFHIIEVRAINDCGLSDPAYFGVNVFELPVVDLGNDTSIFIGQTLTLDADNPGCTYLWSTGETTQAIYVTQSGNYEVVVSNPCGDVSDDINVDVIVGIDNVVDKEKLIVRVTGDQISIDAPDINIKKIQVWDMAGKLLIDSNRMPFYYLPEKGFYIIRVTAFNGNVFNCRIIK